MLKLTVALLSNGEEITEDQLRMVLDAFVKSYGGVPGESRYRLDNLLKYGKNELTEPEKP